VAVVTRFAREHSVGLFLRGIVETLGETGGFEVRLFQPPGSRTDPTDGTFAAIRQAVSSTSPDDLGVEQLPHELAAARQALENFAPDAIFYPELGMDTFTYLLSFSRLAPGSAYHAWQQCHFRRPIRRLPCILPHE